MTSRRLFLFEPTLATPQFASVFCELDRTLRARGIRVEFSRRTPERCEDYWSVLLHEPQPNLVPTRRSSVLGQRTLNRRERLWLAEAIGLPVVPWSSPRTSQDLLTLLTRWRRDVAVLKLDSSPDRKGVSLLSTGDRLPDSYSPLSDVIMLYVDDDPMTVVVDVFFDQVVGTFVLDTPPIRAKSFRTADYAVGRITPTEEVIRIAAKLGPTLMRYGAGYVSVHLMKYEGRYAIVDINTSRPSPELAWPRWRSTYIGGYAHALTEWVALAQTPPRWDRVVAATGMLRECVKSSGR